MTQTIKDIANDTYAIDLQNVSKIFSNKSSIKKGGYTTLKDSVVKLFNRPDNYETNSSVAGAISKITLRIPKGSSCGIIGRNGSGKSTLLKLISGIYKPTNGTISVNGRMAALIELGAGFHPDFTGRENLFLAGVMHGLSRKEITEKFDEIVAFAELEEVIDQPVRTYSSGMFMRLGFSIAVFTNPDIFMVDEVLAVGDARFVVKCREKLSALKRQGKTFLLVSHDLDTVERWCNEVVWLDKGHVMDRGSPRRVIDHYRQFIEKNEEDELLDIVDQSPDIPNQEDDKNNIEWFKEERWGSKEIEIVEVFLATKDNVESRVLHSGDDLNIIINYQINENRDNPAFGIAVQRDDGLMVFGTNSIIEQVKLELKNQKGTLKIVIPSLQLLDGKYTLDVAVHALDGYPYDYRRKVITFAVRGAKHGTGVYMPQLKWII
jgi:lipopolysaccharide transport system ATP-binding protein